MIQSTQQALVAARQQALLAEAETERLAGLARSAARGASPSRTTGPRGGLTAAVLRVAAVFGGAGRAAAAR
jgi:hypothetical protein